MGQRVPGAKVSRQQRTFAQVCLPPVKRYFSEGREQQGVGRQVLKGACGMCSQHQHVAAAAALLTHSHAPYGQYVP